ncbi:cellulose synthase family protein [Secundilactobacillus oryzae JCM 18671]|uniref:Cellulose synthase family protein n=1 Tax=Secundilactobacillus oryzae JCM 18671 TaxID=1291743 RepID=A0A081BHA0_9LACO|nr:cellulose synthase family protein [Secundilactobacillus oryzae JCM 18671]
MAYFLALEVVFFVLDCFSEAAVEDSAAFVLSELDVAFFVELATFVELAALVLEVFELTALELEEAAFLLELLEEAT